MGIKKLVIAPSQLGRICIGTTVERNGKTVPQKTDSIRITSNAMSNKEWEDHPVMTTLKKHEGKVTEIPVRILFDKIENNLSTSYSCFNTKGRQICVGDGETAKRRGEEKVEQVECTGPEFCTFGKAYYCKLFSRFTVAIDDENYEKNPTAGYVFRSTGWNSAKALSAQLMIFSAACEGQIAGFPATLKIHSKSSTASMKTKFFYLDLLPKDSLLKAVQETKARREQIESQGLKWNLIEDAISGGLSQSPFAEDEENGQMILNEFFEDVDSTTGEITGKEKPVKLNIVNSPMQEPSQGGPDQHLQSQEMPSCPTSDPKSKEADYLGKEEVQSIKDALQNYGKSIEELNMFLARDKDAPLETMGQELFNTKVRAALNIPELQKAA